jgi:hypothetical protein
MFSSHFWAAKHIVDQKSGHFDPKRFEDHYETALQDLLQKKQNGQPIAKIASRTSGNIIDIMDALRASLKDSKSAPATKPAKVPARRLQSPSRRQNARWVSAGTRTNDLASEASKKAPNKSGPFLHRGVHPPYAAEAFLFTPLRVATVFSLVLAAFSSFRFVVNRRTTSSWPSSSAQAMSVP